MRESLNKADRGLPPGRSFPGKINRMDVENPNRAATTKEDLPIQGGPLHLSVRSRFFRLLSTAFRVLSYDFAVDDLAQSAFRAEHDPFYEQSVALLRRFETTFRGEPEGRSAYEHQLVSHAFFPCLSLQIPNSDGAQCRMCRFHRDCVEGMRRQNKKGLPGFSQKVFEVFWIA